MAPIAIANGIFCRCDVQIRSPEYNLGMLIPHERLSTQALRSIIEEFVTRDGTDHSAVERRVETVLHQLSTGQVDLHFDRDTQTCNIRER